MKPTYTGLTYARQCDQCKQGMNDGFVIENGEAYYCSETCLHKNISVSHWHELYDHEEGDSYYTEWEEDDHQYRELSDGTLEEIE